MKDVGASPAGHDGKSLSWVSLGGPKPLAGSRGLRGLIFGGRGGYVLSL